jgi:hypothetical protein
VSSSVYEFRPAAIQIATAPSRSSFGSVVSICDSPSRAKDAIEPTPSNRDGLGCARGIRAAFVLEGGMALLLYGVWQLAHWTH